MQRDDGVPCYSSGWLYSVQSQADKERTSFSFSLLVVACKQDFIGQICIEIIPIIVSPWKTGCNVVMHRRGMGQHFITEHQTYTHSHLRAI